MRTKRKLSITINYKLLEKMEKASKIHHFSKSRLSEEAIKLSLGLENLNTARRDATND